MPSSAALAVEEDRGKGIGYVMGLLESASSIGFIVGPLIAGIVEGLIGLDSVFYLAAFVGLLGTMLFVTLAKASINSPPV
jgi:MFS family permease